MNTQKISFVSQGYKLGGHLVAAENPKPLAFLFIQGWMGHQNIVAAQELANLGFTCMTYDMHGNGESEGRLADFTRADFIADSEVAYDYLKKQLSPGAEIGVIGSSFGGYTAILLSRLRPVKCLSLRVVASYPDTGFNDLQLPQVASAGLAAWRNEPLNFNNRAYRALHDFTGKVQIIEADRDNTVPRQTLLNYAEAITNKDNLEYVVMHDAPHTLENEQLRKQYIKLLCAWANRI